MICLNGDNVIVIVGVDPDGDPRVVTIDADGALVVVT